MSAGTLIIILLTVVPIYIALISLVAVFALNLDDFIDCFLSKRKKK